jgi:hypothetical protein
MSMNLLRFPVAVILQRTPVVSPWATERWDPVAVLPCDAPAGPEAPARMEDGAAGTRWRFEGHAIELHRSEAEGYFLNLSAPHPAIFVMWREADDALPPAFRPALVTVSYNEAARLMDSGERVDTVPMLPEVRAWMTPFVAEHYKPEPRRKVRRNDPFADRAPGRNGERSH